MDRLGRQQAHHRAAGRRELTGAAHQALDPSGGTRSDGAVGETDLRVRELRRRCLHLSAGGGDLVLARRQPGDAELRLKLGQPSLLRREARTRLVEDARVRGGRACQLLLARELAPSEAEIGLRLRDLRLDRPDLVGALAG
jgi:hypothetical protein